MARGKKITYDVLARIELDTGTLVPGDRVTETELKDAGQSADDIVALLHCDAITLAE